MRLVMLLVVQAQAVTQTQKGEVDSCRFISEGGDEQAGDCVLLVRR
jgi:hypothetical protein